MTIDLNEVFHARREETAESASSQTNLTKWRPALRNGNHLGYENKLDLRSIFVENILVALAPVCVCMDVELLCAFKFNVECFHASDVDISTTKLSDRRPTATVERTPRPNYCAGGPEKRGRC